MGNHHFQRQFSINKLAFLLRAICSTERALLDIAQPISITVAPDLHRRYLQFVDLQLKIIVLQRKTVGFQ